MEKRLSLEKDLKFKARFLELLFLITVLLIAFGPSAIDGYLLGTAVAFAIFGLLLYSQVINGRLPENISETMTVGFAFAGILVLSLRPAYTANALPIAVLFLLSAGYIVSIGLLPERQFWPTYFRYSVTDLKNYLKELKDLKTEDLKQSISADSKNLAISFGISLFVFIATVAAWSTSTGQTVELTHVILAITGTFIAGGALDRWVLE